MLLYSCLRARLAPAAISVAASRGAAARSEFFWKAVTSSAASSTAAAAAWRQRVEGVAPGSVLRFDLSDSAVDLAVRVGEHEAIELDCTSPLSSQQLPHDHPGSSIVTLTQDEAEQRGQQPLQLNARSPSRFLTVEASTAGGSVAVEVIQEGSLRLTTHGANISVPKVKAYDAHISSGGGAISGAVTGVDVRLHSSGGAMQLKSLVGKRVEVDSGGGGVTLGACYADYLRVQSGGGPVTVTNIDCRGADAMLHSTGGRVEVGSLDGNLSISSEGGHVQVQLHDNAGTVSIASGGGDVQLYVGPACAGRILLRNCARIACRPSMVRMAQPQDDGCLALTLPLRDPVATTATGQKTAGSPALLSRLQRGAHGGQPHVQQHAAGGAGSASTIEQTTDVLVDAGGRGTVAITERSWMEALRRRCS